MADSPSSPTPRSRPAAAGGDDALRPARRPIGRTLRRSMRGQLVSRLLVLLGAFTLVGWVADLVMLSDFLLNRGLGAAQVGRVALLRTLPVLTAALPLALLFAVLVSIGRIRADGELGAMEACGVSPLSLLRPVSGFALGVTVLALALALVVSPRANRQLNADMVDVAGSSPGASLQSGATASFDDLRVQAREVGSDGESLRAVAAWIPSLGGTVFARRASIVAMPPTEGDDDEFARVVLEEGLVLAGSEGEPSIVRFGRSERVIEMQTQDAVGSFSAVSTPELLELARTEEHLERQAMAELHRRVALPAATFLFGVLAVPLSLAGSVGRSRSGGMLIGLVLTVAYYGLVQMADGLTRNPDFPLAVALWIPNALLGSLALGMIGWRLRSRRSAGSGERSRQRTRAGGRLRLRRKVLDRYVLRSFVGLALLSLGGLLLATLLVDFLDNLKWFTKYQSTLDEVFRYYTVRTPILLSRVMPMALVVSAALTMGLLATTGELTGMRSCGISSARMATPILLACLFIAGFYHLLANEWVPHASAAATRIKQTEIKNRNQMSDVWYREGNILYEVDRIDPVNSIARGVTFYELLPDGLPRAVTRASGARLSNDKEWKLQEARRWIVTDEGLVEDDAPEYARLGSGVPNSVETGDMPLGVLRDEIRDAQAAGRAEAEQRFRVDLQLRLAAPLACILLPALALAFAVSGPPYPSGGQVLVVSFLLVLAQGLLSAAGAALGYGGLHPLAAGWGPLLLLIASGLILGRRFHRTAWSS